MTYATETDASFLAPVSGACVIGTSKADSDLLEVVKLVLVRSGDGDEGGAWLQVLSNAARVSTVLIKSAKQRHLVVHVRQLDVEPHVDVKRVRRAVLQQSQRTCFTVQHSLTDPIRRGPRRRAPGHLASTRLEYCQV